MASRSALARCRKTAAFRSGATGGRARSRRETGSPTARIAAVRPSSQSPVIRTRRAFVMRATATARPRKVPRRIALTRRNFLTLFTADLGECLRVVRQSFDVSEVVGGHHPLTQGRGQAALQPGRVF